MNAVDTNVLVYAYDESSPAKRDRARALLASLGDGVLLWQVANEFVAASRKMIATGTEADVIWDRLDEIRTVFPLVLPTASAFGHARTLHVKSQTSFWDAMLFGACLEAGITRLYSEDVPGAPVAGLEIVNPFAE